MSPSHPPVVGIQPWLPWPFSAWSWWTEPVAAERLAALRIGAGLCMLADLGVNYGPEVLTYFAKGSLGDPDIFNWRFQPPRATWSLLRGVGDSATISLSLILWLLCTGWILGNALARFFLVHQNPPAQDRTGIALGLWNFSFLWYVAGLWSTMIAVHSIDELAWIVPLGGFSICCLLLALDLLIRLRDPSYRIAWLALPGSLLHLLALLAAGLTLWWIESLDAKAWWMRLLLPWQDDPPLLIAAMVVWFIAALFLTMGCCTRFAAILTWLLSMSFANANPYLDNAGDTIRQILLFYLMLCPCGAVWSVDTLWKRNAGPVDVHPWPIRLLFVQMIFMYWMNGIYKLFGENWLNGYSLYYVLGDAALTRFSQVKLPIPLELTRLMTWSVMIWEATFPFLVLWKWTRRLTLIFGVLFHLGIFATMELALFVPYALCMYLPLIPWEWWSRRSDKQPIRT